MKRKRTQRSGVKISVILNEVCDRFFRQFRLKSKALYLLDILVLRDTSHKISQLSLSKNRKRHIATSHIMATSVDSQ